MIQKVVVFLQLGRPHFLVGGFVMHGLGVSAALWAGAPLDLRTLLWTQAAITSTQFMLQYCNEYFDLEADRANLVGSAWSGGSRVLPMQLLPARVALMAALVLGGAALLSAAVLAFIVSPLPLTLPLLVLALGLSWSYSGPPLRLQARGVGPMVGAIVVGVLTPLLGFYVQYGGLLWTPLLAIVPVACLQAAMLVVVDLPDAEGDRLAGKQTLVVRIGEARGRALYRILLTVTYLALPPLIALGLPWQVAAGAALTVPLAAWLGRPGPHLGPDVRDWNTPVFLSIGLLIACAVLESVAFLWLVFG